MKSAPAPGTAAPGSSESGAARGDGTPRMEERSRSREAHRADKAEWSKQGSQQGPTKSCRPGLHKIPHRSHISSRKWSKDVSWEKAGQMLGDTSLHPFTAGSCSKGELRWESLMETECIASWQCSTHHLGCNREQRAPRVPPNPCLWLCTPHGMFLCRKQAQLGEKPERAKVSNCGLINRRGKTKSKRDPNMQDLHMLPNAAHQYTR